MINMRTEFNRADDAFIYFYDLIRYTGVDFYNKKALFNVVFTVTAFAFSLASLYKILYSSLFFNPS